ncbi:MAG: hypothetical protein V2A66_07300 [Pseudomonadota bacterium]
MFTLGVIGIMCCVSGTVISVIASIITTAVTVGVSVDQKNSAEDNARKMENLQKEQNNKSDARAKGLSEINKAITLKNLRQTRSAFASASAYERLLTEKTNRDAVRKRQEANINSVHNVEQTSKPSLRSQNTGYNKGTPSST